MARAKALPDELLTRGIEDITVRQDLEKKLKSGQKLRIKHGVDPTTADLHIGYAVTYWKLRAFQELGHTVVFLIGDFTARFGDPDKSQQRPMRTKAEVDQAAESYLDQIKDILDLKKTEIRRNSEWYDSMSAEELIRLTSNFSVAQLLERDKFIERRDAGAPIGYHEPIYPILQGYDSVMLKSDLTVVGSDQLFNELMARPLQERAGQRPQDVMTMSLLIGTDGDRKMSQSLGNTIGITDAPEDQFGKVMRIDDGLIGHYFELATRVPTAKIQQILAAMTSGELPPREAKLLLASEVVTLYHGKRAARRAHDEFIQVFSRRELPSAITEHHVTVDQYRLDQLLVDLALAPSRAAAQRLVIAGAIRIDGAVVGDWRAEIALHDGMIVQAGKRHFRKIRRLDTHDAQ